MTHSISMGVVLRSNQGLGDTTLEPVDYRGRYFRDDIVVATDPAFGPGYYIFGRCPTSGVTKNIARPEGARVACRHYNNRCYRGWKTKAEAQKWVPLITQLLEDQPPLRCICAA